MKKYTYNTVFYKLLEIKNYSFQMIDLANEIKKGQREVEINTYSS